MVSGINSSEIKQHNLSAILITLLHNDNVSRSHLAQLIGVSTATITNLVAELVGQGFILEKGLIKSNGQPNVGRPQKALKLISNARYALGVHIDVGRVYVALTNMRGQLLQSHSFEHSITTPWQQVMNQVVDLIRDTVSRQNITDADIVGVGVAASGLVDPETGVNVIAPNLNWYDVPICDYLSDRLSMPMVVENNVRAMVLGEALLGSGRDANTMAFVYARVGVGAGLAVNGRIFRGSGAGAGEIGHTLLVREQNQDGQRVLRSLESLVSEPAILRIARRMADEQPKGILAKHIAGGLTIDAIFNAVRAGDDSAIELMDDCAFYTGIALANLVNIFNPELIVLGGLFTQEKNLLLPMIKQVVRENAFANLGESVRIQTAFFENDAGMIGAAALALDRFLYRPLERC
jgi:predicted NBD/HSP70 family sugar kinase